MIIQTFAGELRALSSYADYLAHDYDDDPCLRRQVERAYRRRLDSHLSKRMGELDLPTYLIESIHATKEVTVVAAHEERTTSEAPYVVAGPWQRGGYEENDDDQWAALVWVDVGDEVPHTMPDYCVVLDGALSPAGFADDVWSGVADVRGHAGSVTCKQNGGHQWDYPAPAGERPYEQLCDDNGARCPRCDSQLYIRIFYGEGRFYDSGDVPWNGPSEAMDR